MWGGTFPTAPDPGRTQRTSSSPGCGHRDNATHPRSNKSPGRWKQDAGVCFVTALHCGTPCGQRCLCLHIPRLGAVGICGDPSHCSDHSVRRTPHQSDPGCRDEPFSHQHLHHSPKHPSTHQHPPLHSQLWLLNSI